MMKMMKKVITMYEETLQAAKKYFAKNLILKELVDKYYTKYKSLGHWGGTAVFTDISTEDKNILESFLGEDLGAAKNIKIPFSHFFKAWHKTKFADLPLENFLANCCSGSLLSKQQEKEIREHGRQKILKNLLVKYSSAAARKWIMGLLHKDVKLAHREYETNRDLQETVVKALDDLPAKYERLPFFANRVSSNPHAFDWDRPAGSMFIQALAYISDAGGKIRNIDDKTQLLYKYHILRDDIMNFATAAGLRAYVRGQEIKYWTEAAKLNAPLNLPLREIARADEILPYNIRKKTSAEQIPVFIVENSGVFSTLLDILQEKNIIIPLLCLHGQLKTASWALLDKLQKNGVSFYYSGDFDPEGLIIAQKILLHYPDCTHLWHFSKEEYLTNLQAEHNSGRCLLSGQRLLKLQNITHPALLPQAAAIREKKKALYQESFTDKLLADMIENYNI